jgi:hypothetical protein
LATTFLGPGIVQIRLTKKLAGALNGLDLRPFTVGEVLDLEDSFARMLISEGWAEMHTGERALADDRPRRKRRPNVEPA